MRVGAMLVALFVSFIGGAMLVMGTVAVLENSAGVRSEGWLWLSGVAAGLLGMGASMFCGMIVRDWLLRKRIRFAIFNRGVCQKCDYSLVGMPVSAKSTVMCPECGMESEVDPALGELVQDASGKPVLRAVDESLMPKARKPRIFTAARMKRAAKWAAVLALVLIIGAVGWYIWERYETARQAEIAKKERPGAAGIIALQETVLSRAAGSDQPDGWARISEIYTRVQIIDTKVWSSAPDTPFPEYGYFQTSEEDIAEDQRARWRAGRDLALRMMDEMRSAGVLTQLDELAQVRRALYAPLLNEQLSAVGTMMPELSHARGLARVNSLRMHQAYTSGDVRGFQNSMESNLAISRFCSTHPFLITQFVGLAIQGMTMSVVRDILMEKPSAEWLDAIDRARMNQALSVPRGYAARGERLFAMDTLCWLFSEPNRTSGTALRQMTGMGPLEGRMGSYTSNRDVMEGLFKAYERALVQHRWERDPFDERAALSSNLLLVGILAPALSRTVQSFDAADLERGGIDVMVALERFRFRTGAYPERLEQLVPGEMKAMPLDPWSGKALGYRRVEPGQDKHKRGYLLYSVGADGKDDGGKEYQGMDLYRKPLVDPGIPGADYILNDPRR